MSFGMVEIRKRRSRMCRVSAGKRIELTPRDLELFKVLSRYRYLPSNFLYAFAGGASEKRFIERLGHLYHDGRYVNRPEQQWTFANARYMPVVYELDDAGYRALFEHGIAANGRDRRPARQFAHSLMVCEILASIELSTRASGSLRFISANEIIAKAPLASHSGYPLAFPVSIEHPMHGAKKICRAEFTLVPDAVFGLEYEGKKYRFFALEADRNTMPVRRAELRQSSYLRKILAYRAIVAQQLYKSRLALPNLLVLNVTTNEEHMHNIMALLKDLTGGSTMFLFKAAPGVGDFVRPLAPMGFLTSDQWLRVGHDPLHLMI